MTWDLHVQKVSNGFILHTDNGEEKETIVVEEDVCCSEVCNNVEFLHTIAEYYNMHTSKHDKEQLIIKSSFEDDNA